MRSLGELTTWNNYARFARYLHSHRRLEIMHIIRELTRYAGILSRATWIRSAADNQQKQFIGHQRRNRYGLSCNLLLYRNQAPGTKLGQWIHRNRIVTLYTGFAWSCNEIECHSGIASSPVTEQWFRTFRLFMNLFMSRSKRCDGCD